MDEKKGEAILPEEPQTETAAEESPKGFTRRQVVAGGIGVGLVGLIAGGALAKWGVIEDTIASGRMAVNVTPTKLIVTDRARCSGCQRCEMMCSLRNDGRVCQTTARVRVWPNYNFGEGSNGPDGIYRNCQFTVEHCKQCKDAACMKNCPVHAIYADPETGARVVDTDKLHRPRNAPRGLSVEHAANRPGYWQIHEVHRVRPFVAVQCPNGAIKFVDSARHRPRGDRQRAWFVRRPCSPRPNLATNLTCLRKDTSWIA